MNRILFLITFSYYNCHEPPIIFHPCILNKKVGEVFPIEPLHHILLGPPNDVLEALSERFPDQIHDFYVMII